MRAGRLTSQILRWAGFALISPEVKKGERNQTTNVDDRNTKAPRKGTPPGTGCRVWPRGPLGYQGGCDGCCTRDSSCPKGRTHVGLASMAPPACRLLTRNPVPWYDLLGTDARAARLAGPHVRRRVTSGVSQVNVCDREQPWPAPLSRADEGAGVWVWQGEVATRLGWTWSAGLCGVDGDRALAESRAAGGHCACGRLWLRGAGVPPGQRAPRSGLQAKVTVCESFLHF